MNFIENLYNVLEAARPVEFPEVEKIYMDSIPDANLPGCSIGLVCDDPEYISTGENSRRAVKQTIYIVINWLILHRNETDVIADVRATDGKVKSVLKSNPRLNNFLVMPGRIVTGQEAQAAPTAEKSRISEIQFEGEYFEGGDS